MTNSTKAYSALTNYVKRNNRNSTFDGNTLRERMGSFNLKPNQYGAIVGKAIRQGIIVKVGETASSNPKHNMGRVGVYTRGLNSYTH